MIILSVLKININYINMIHCSVGLSCPNNLNFLHHTNYIRRAGIIPFLVDARGITYMLLGLSKEKNPVWADLGGRREGNETTLQTAIREFNEESRSVLSIDLNRITKIIITGHNKPDQVIIVIEIDPTQHNININNIIITSYFSLLYFHFFYFYTLPNTV